MNQCVVVILSKRFTVANELMGANLCIDNFIESDVSSAEVFLEDFDGFIDRINTEPEFL